MKLYQVEGALRAFLDELEASDGEMTPEQEERLRELCGSSERLLDVLGVIYSESYAKFNINDAAYRAALKEAEVFKKLAARYSKRGDDSHDRMLHLMKMLKMEEHKSLLFSLKISHAPVRTVVLPEGFDIEKLPKEFVREKKEVNKQALTALYDATDCELPCGITLVQTEFVRIIKR